MNRNISTKFWVMMIFFLVSACVTVNIYFPAAEVRKAAEDIVKDVREQQPAGSEENSSLSPTSWFFSVAEAHAASELTVSNATIRQLKARMKKRFPSLAPYMARGLVGEGLNGLLTIKSLAGLGLKEKAKLKKLVDAENKDRMALYRAVAQALNIPSSQLSRVQSIFAQQWQKTAPKGTFIEIKPGKWVRK
ncbi:MAG: YdbL family protein [Thermodesulfobacteria bacterium]|nr:YdbL family protein [Thermodesulfobacteriota bacterium]